MEIRDNIKELLLGKIMKIKIYGFDKYGGRFIGDIFISELFPKKNKKSFDYTLSDYLLENNYAKPYDGGKKDKWN